MSSWSTASLLVGMLLLGAPAAAQDDNPSPSMDRMQQRMEAMQAELDGLQAQMNEMRGRMSPGGQMPAQGPGMMQGQMPLMPAMPMQGQMPMQYQMPMMHGMGPMQCQMPMQYQMPMMQGMGAMPGHMPMMGPMPMMGMGQMPMMGMAEPPAAGDHAHGGGPSADAFRGSMLRMHQGMGVGLSGDADRDFAKLMIAHHQGAIDMARVELEHGKDPALRKLAEHVIAARTREIEMLRARLTELAK